MAISYKQVSLGDYAKQAAAYAQQAAASSWSPEVGYTSNAYANPITGQPYSIQDLINMGGGDPNKMIQVPIGQDFMAQWGWTLPILAAAGAAVAAPAAGGAATVGDAGAMDAAITGMSVPGASLGTGAGATAGGLGLGDLATTLGKGAASGAISSAFPKDFVSSSSAGGVPTASDLSIPGSITSADPFNLATAGTGTGGTFLDDLKSTLGNIFGNGNGNGGGSGSVANGSYQFPWSQAIGAALGAYGSNQAANQYSNLIDKVINADQWRNQQPNYFQPLLDATTKGIGNTPYGQSILNSVMRSSAAKGYNMSGNFVTDAENALNQGTTDYIKAVTPLAMGNSPYGAQSAAMNLGSQAVAQNQNTYGNLGYGLGSVISGQQPTALQSLFASATGNPTQNNNLIQAFGLS